MLSFSKKFPVILATCVLVISCASKKGSQGGFSEMPVVKDPSALDPKNPPRVAIKGLQHDELLTAPRSVEIVVDGYPMEENWQGFEVAINDQAPQRFHKSPLTFQIPAAQLRKGANLLKVYLVRSWGESVKLPEAFAFVPFFSEAKPGLSWVAPKRPILTLVSPRGSYKGESAKKILFDFIVQNPEKQPTVYRVHYTLDGKKMQLESDKSYYFYNLTKGEHELRVEVVNNRGIPLGQEVTRSRSVFTVED
jgi:hypothetical protein